MKNETKVIFDFTMSALTNVAKARRSLLAQIDEIKEKLPTIEKECPHSENDVSYSDEIVYAQNRLEDALKFLAYAKEEIQGTLEALGELEEDEEDD